ncbi:hypothetical protein NFI96_007520 [Prochilodus magdalenae]|nr:hypothetical protein NFI96_007520 [Prochilodus magdalenae]
MWSEAARSSPGTASALSLIPGHSGLQNLLILIGIHASLKFNKIPSPSTGHTAPQHDGTTTKLYLITSHGFSYHCYAHDTQLMLSFPSSDTQVCNRISACLTDISSWMTAHHLKLNPSKTELLFIPSTTGPHRDLAISFGNSLITPTEDARSLGVILDGQLSFSAHIANLTRSCRFLLYNIRGIRPFLFQEATQLLVQSLVISRLDYCNSLLAGLPLRAIRPLQLVQNAAARLIFNLPKFTHVTPLLRSLHWLPVVAHIRFKTLMLAYKAKNGPAPHYLMAMVKSRAVPRALRASSTAPPSLRTHGRQASRLFSVLAPRWWNELPLGVRTAESLAVFKRRLKTHLFMKHLSTSTGPLFGQCLSSWVDPAFFNKIMPDHILQQSQHHGYVGEGSGY